LETAMTTREKIDLIGPLAIVQGETYLQLTWTVPGDKSAWTARGQIRTALLEDDGVLLAEFQFDTPIYDASVSGVLAALSAVNLTLTPEVNLTLTPEMLGEVRSILDANGFNSVVLE
jgi:hypothetical protein